MCFGSVTDLRNVTHIEYALRRLSPKLTMAKALAYGRKCSIALKPSLTKLRFSYLFSGFSVNRANSDLGVLAASGCKVVRRVRTSVFWTRSPNSSFHPSIANGSRNSHRPLFSTAQPFWSC